MADEARPAFALLYNSPFRSAGGEALTGCPTTDAKRRKSKHDARADSLRDQDSRRQLLESTAELPPRSLFGIDHNMLG